MTLLGTVCLLHKTSPALFAHTNTANNNRTTTTAPSASDPADVVVARNVTLEELTSTSAFLLDDDLDLEDGHVTAAAETGPRSLSAVETRLFGRRGLTFDLDYDGGTRSNGSDSTANVDPGKSLLDRITDGLAGFHPHSTSSTFYDRIPQLMINPFETGEELLKMLRKRARVDLWGGNPNQCVKGQGQGHEQCSRSPFGGLANGLLRPVTGLA